MMPGLVLRTIYKGLLSVAGGRRWTILGLLWRLCRLGCARLQKPPSYRKKDGASHYELKYSPEIQARNSENPTLFLDDLPTPHFRWFTLNHFASSILADEGCQLVSALVQYSAVEPSLLAHPGFWVLDCSLGVLVLVLLFWVPFFLGSCSLFPEALQHDLAFSFVVLVIWVFFADSGGDDEAVVCVRVLRVPVVFCHPVEALCFVDLPAVFAVDVVSLSGRVDEFVDGVRSSRFETIAKLKIRPAAAAGVGFHLPGAVLRSPARVEHVCADCGGGSVF